MPARSKQFFNDVKEHFKLREYLWKYKLIVCLPIFCGLLTLDIISKQLAFNLLPYNVQVPFLDGFINFQLIINKGIAFGANADNLAGTIVGAVLITVLALLLFLYANQKVIIVGLVMIVTGGFGNLVDRMWNNGGVVDFLAWVLFPPYSIFNLADMWVTFGVVVIVIGVIISIIKYYREYHKEGIAHPEREE
ncbi:signal peptidase II [Spiroplasma chrysopicola]|uniref:Lipoprotein signal peptidase n=1 Tax=Spiroplasma chrysopicola DF-1 TaxID=1276227 RepID=R4U3X5_9MOLU|nr:signal peptidase II [Spiroplasma chrysopicola]AGM25223.1 lipoprotein signal peptidase [Spiroplasma chrysopicola DF-1]